MVNSVCDGLLALLAAHGADHVPSSGEEFVPLTLSDREAALAVESFRVLALVIDAVSNRHFSEFRCSDLLHQFLACDRMDALEAALHLLAGIGRHRRTTEAAAEERLVARLNSICQSGGMDGSGCTLRQLCTEPISALGDRAGHLYFEFYLTKEHLTAAGSAAPAGAEPGVVTISLQNLYQDSRSVAEILAALKAEYAVPPEFQYDLAVAIVSCQAFGDLPLRQSGLRIRLLAASALGVSGGAWRGVCHGNTFKRVGVEWR